LGIGGCGDLSQRSQPWLSRLFCAIVANGGAVSEPRPEPSTKWQLEHQSRANSCPAAASPEEVIFRGDAHRFVAGEYISITERNGVTHTFRVASVH